METERSLDQFGEALRRNARGEELRELLAALHVLREYFLDYAELNTVEAIRPADLREFGRDWLIRSEEATAASAATALQALEGWVAAFARYHEEPARSELAHVAAVLRREVPRALEVRDLLRAHLAGSDLGAAFELAAEEDEIPVGSASAGLDRIVQLEGVDFSQAEQDEWELIDFDAEGLMLRRLLTTEGIEPLAGPVRVPPAAAALLRPGDILNLELAPGPQGWELLEVLGVYPGGA